jgi:hypothetical protein
MRTSTRTLLDNLDYSLKAQALCHSMSSHHGPKKSKSMTKYGCAPDSLSDDSNWAANPYMTQPDLQKFTDMVVKLSQDQLLNLLREFQDYNQSEINVVNNPPPGAGAYDMNAVQGGIALSNAKIQILTNLIGTINSSPADLTPLTDKYGDQDTGETQEPGRLEAFAQASDPSTLKRRYKARSCLNKLSDNEREQLSGGFFSNIGHDIANVVRKVPVIGNPMTKLWRYSAAAGLNPFVPLGVAQMFLPAGTRQKMFGLTTKESSQFETIAKVERGVAAAVAVAVTGGASMGAFAPAGAAGATAAGATAAGTTAATAAGGSSVLGTVGAVAGITTAGAALKNALLPTSYAPALPGLGGGPVPSPDLNVPNFDLSQPANPFANPTFDVDTGLPSNPSNMTDEAGLYSKNLTTQAAPSLPDFAKSLNGIETGAKSASDVTSSLANKVLNGLQSTTTIIKAGNDLVVASRGPDGSIQKQHYDTSQVPGASSLRDGVAYPSVAGGFGGGGSAGFAPSTAGDGSGISAMEQAVQDIQAGKTGANAPGVQTSKPFYESPVLWVGLLAAGAAYFYYKPAAFNKVKKTLAGAFRSAQGQVKSWAS